jgi:hypothetical protein
MLKSKSPRKNLVKVEESKKSENKQEVKTK